MEWKMQWSSRPKHIIYAILFSTIHSALNDQGDGDNGLKESSIHKTVQICCHRLLCSESAITDCSTVRLTCSELSIHKRAMVQCNCFEDCFLMPEAVHWYVEQKQCSNVHLNEIKCNVRSYIAVPSLSVRGRCKINIARIANAVQCHS